MTDAEMVTAIVSDLSVELASDPGFNLSVLEAKATSAVNEVKRERRYTYSGLTDEEIESDIEQFYSNIRNLTLYDYNEIGAEFQSYTGEGAIFRTYADRNKLLHGVIPLAVCG